MPEFKTYKTLQEVEANRSFSNVVSTRDLDIDWESWEQHVFFGSAQARLNSAVEFIRTTFPFDGTFAELKEWRQSLNGWQDWLLNERWNYNLRSINFDENNIYAATTEPQKPDNIPAIYTIDLEALKIKNEESKKTANKLNPKSEPLSVECWIRVFESSEGFTAVSTHRNVDGEGWTVALQRTSDGFRVAGHLALSLGTFAPNYAVSRGVTSEEFSYDTWHHVNVSWSSAGDGRSLRIIVDGKEREIENVLNEAILTPGLWRTESIDPHLLGWAPSPQLGVGGDVYPGWEFTTFGGFQVDEYRVWHKQLSLREVEDRRFVNVWQEPGLVLQYRFNDCPETMLNFQGTPILGILDSSGNSLHGQRQPGSFAIVPTGQQFRPQLFLDRPEMLRERLTDHPSIYPLDTTLNLRLQEFLNDGKDYDESNPNLITKLIPRHYFENPLGLPRTQLQENDALFEGEDGAFLLAALLYTWADFWDDMKLRGDALITALHLNVDGSGSARPLLPIIAKELGVTLPMIFEEVVPEFWDEEYERIQETVWRRVLTVLPKILKRKGTLAGIRTLFNAVGTWQMDGAIRLREYGYQSSTIADSRRTIEQQLRFVKTEEPPIIRFVRERLA